MKRRKKARQKKTEEERGIFSRELLERYTAKLVYG